MTDPECLEEVVSAPVSISIVVSTLGRMSLAKTLESAVPQLEGDDEVVVVSDGPSREASEICSGFGVRVRYFETEPVRRWGNDQKNFGMDRASGTHLAFMDDDDVYCDDALKNMRRVVSNHPFGPILFRSIIRGKTLWKTAEVKPGNVGTPMIVVPNTPARLGKWRVNDRTKDGRGGDFMFIRDTVGRWPEGSVLWSTDILSIVTVKGNGKP